LTEIEQQLENYAVYPVHPDGWAESVFATEDFSQNLPTQYRVNPDGWTEDVFSDNMYAVIPVHRELSGGAQIGTEYFQNLPVEWSQPVFRDGSSSKAAPGVNDLLAASL
jgi:hypothetical protein